MKATITDARAAELLKEHGNRPLRFKDIGALMEGVTEVVRPYIDQRLAARGDRQPRRDDAIFLIDSARDVS